MVITVPTQFELAVVDAPFDAAIIVVILFGCAFGQKPSPYVIDGHPIDQIGTFMSVACLWNKRAVLLFAHAIRNIKNF